MERLEAIAKQLTTFLHSSEINFKELDLLLDEMRVSLKANIRLLDFEYYNEERLTRIVSWKNIFIKCLNFEAAANQRDLEKKCLRYLDLKAELVLQESAFYRDMNTLFYCYFGTAKNDIRIREYLRKYSDSIREGV